MSSTKDNPYEVKYSELTIDAITSLYMYDSLEKPENSNDLLSNDIVRDPIISDNDHGSYVEVTDLDAYMQEGPGRFATANRFDLVNDFFDGNYDELILEGGGHTLEILRPDSKKGEHYTDNRVFSMTHAFYDLNADDHETRTYVYSSAAFVFTSGTLHVDEIKGENGEVIGYDRYITDLVIAPRYDDFDFESDNPLIQISNYFSRDKIDPSDIGRRVQIQYDVNNITPIERYDVDDYKNDIKDMVVSDYDKGLDKAREYTFSLGDELFDSGTTKTVDGNGRAIIYGTNGNDTINNPDDYLPVHTNSAKDSPLEQYWYAQANNHLDC